MNRSTIAIAFASLLVTGTLVGGCQVPTSHEYDHVDEPASVPEPLAGPRVAPSDVDAEGGGDNAGDCGRGTGRNPDGECVKLTVKDFGYAQRVQIPAGEFVMGFIPSKGYDARPSRERPVVRWSGNPPHHVDLQSFWIDVSEVTNEAYTACVAKGDCTKAECPDGSAPSRSDLAQAESVQGQLPQTCVTHAQAETFCSSHGARLPSEAEWEYAARGVDARIYPWGNELRDELQGGLVPVARTKIDTSYFGIVGMGSNALEWVAEVYDADGPLSGFLSGGFRTRKGPAAKARAEFELGLSCGPSPAPGCKSAAAEPVRHVVKGSIVGARMAAREVVPAFVPEKELEGWASIAHQNDLGFRCAADLGDDVVRLKVPTPAPAIPLTGNNGDAEVFGGVAEAVSRAEAEAFCSVLRVQIGPDLREDWRLPSLAEVTELAEVFKGPGPFWLSDGGAEQSEVTDPQSAWTLIDAAKDEALAARCIRKR